MRRRQVVGPRFSLSQPLHWHGTLAGYLSAFAGLRRHERWSCERSYL